MKGLRGKFANLGVYVTDILPGFVDTPMMKGRDGLFWVASSRKAARQIYDAIKKKKKHAYITKRWIIAALVLKIMPHFLKKKF